MAKRLNFSMCKSIIFTAQSSKFNVQSTMFDVQCSIFNQMTQRVNGKWLMAHRLTDPQFTAHSSQAHRLTAHSSQLHNLNVNRMPNKIAGKVKLELRSERKMLRLKTKETSSEFCSLTLAPNPK